TGNLVFQASDQAIPEHLTLLAGGDVTFNLVGSFNGTVNTTPPQPDPQFDPNTGLPVSATPSTMTIAAGVTIAACQSCANGFAPFTGEPCQNCDGITISGSSSTGGNINMSHFSLVNNGGPVILRADNLAHASGKGNISVASIDTSGVDWINGGSGGAVTISSAGAATTGAISTGSGGGFFGVDNGGGAVTISSGGAVTTGAISTSGGTSGSGAAVAITTGGAATIAAISTSGRSFGGS